MVLSTLIYRYDGLPLCGSVDDDNDSRLKQEKQNVKKLIPTMNGNNNMGISEQVSIDSQYFTIQCLILNGILYFAITELQYPKKLAFLYLDEISSEFYKNYGKEILNLNLRPYAFINFETFLNKTTKLYLDQRTQSNLDKLNDDLNDVKSIMNKNIEDLLARGSSLDKMGDLSNSLRAQSLKYRKAAQKINFDLLIRQYAPAVVVGLFIVFLIWYMFF